MGLWSLSTTMQVTADLGKNVMLYNHEGRVISGFWQYGLVTWDTWHTWLNILIFASDTWEIFEWAKDMSRAREQCFRPSHSVVDPGTYVILRPNRSSVAVGLTVDTPRPRHPTVSNTPTSTENYRTRARDRDHCCLVSGMRVVGGDFTRFRAAHIFPRAHINDWSRNGYPSLVTDPAPLSKVGGSTKIDSIQNVILLRSDLHDAWDSYMFGVNPDVNYLIIPFVAGYEDIAGKHLKLDHIDDVRLRPLDELFRDHFRQGIYKNMKGTGEPNWDYDDALGGGTLDLSRQELWGGEVGKAHLEFELAHRLHSVRVEQDKVSPESPEGDVEHNLLQ